MSERKNIKSNIRINKVYTKNGDSGKTNLIGGALGDKDNLRMDFAEESDLGWFGMAMLGKFQ